MDQESFLDVARRFWRRDDRPPSLRPGRNHRQVAESFDATRWQKAPSVDPPGDGRPISIVDGGRRFAVQASSIAFPPTNQFRFKVKSIPLNEDGTPQDSAHLAGWDEPAEYAAMTGSGLPATFIYEATSDAPRHRWLVYLPPQQAAHGNAGPPMLDLFVPRDGGGAPP